jgi:hypothetical protein
MRDLQLSQLSEDQLLLAAISIVKAAQGDGRDFARNVATVFEALVTKQAAQAGRR